MSVFGDNRPDLEEAYDSAEGEADAIEDLNGGLEEMAEAAHEPLLGADEEDIIMRNYLLAHCHDQNIKLDYKDDALITKILKLKDEHLYATYNYVLHQVKSGQNRGLTDLIVDNIANGIYYIDNDKKTHERIQKDDKLRQLVHNRIGSFHYIPEWLQIVGYLGSYLVNALRSARAQYSARKSGTLPITPSQNASSRI